MTTDKPRTMAIGDFVTQDMFKQIQQILSEVDDPYTEGVGRISKEVMTPNMKEINRKTGQENDPTYLAYAVLHAWAQSTRTQGAS